MSYQGVRTVDYTLDYKKIGYRISRCRKRMKISQAELAELTNLSVGYISHIETGKKKPSLEVLVRVSEALNVTVDRLLLGNQTYDIVSYSPELKELLSDCSNYEKAVIYDLARSVKRSLRNNVGLEKKQNHDWSDF